MSKQKVLVLMLGLCSFSTLLFAQNNELSVSVGGVFATGQNTTSVFPTLCPVTLPNCNVFTSSIVNHSGVAFMGNFSRRITAFGPAALYVEAPVVVGPDRNSDVTFRSATLLGNVVTLTSSSLFFTPAVKVKFLDSSRFAPFATVGGGLAHVGFNTNTRNTGALQFGGGLDFKSPIPHMGFRAEVRDFFSGSSVQGSSFTQVSPAHQHVVFAGGGVFVKF
jgi:hypothetical protein